MLAKMGVLAQVKGLALTADIAADMPDILSGDSARVEQILVNLVSNAIKFTQQGTVQISLYRANAAHWALQVSDTGPGIPLEAQAQIFEPFGQVDSSITRMHTGTGLGLSIVNQLVTLMGGQITLKSQPGQGSIFTVLLPLES
jgi:signal transduction histidine kinase